MSNSSKKNPGYFLPNGILFKSVLFLVMAAIWAVILPALNDYLVRWPLELGTFAIVTSVLTLWILDALDYFTYFHPVPRPDSSLTLLVVVAFTGAVAKNLVMITLGLVVARNREILLITPLVAVAVYALQVLTGMSVVRTGARRKICLFTSSAETDKVLKAFRTKGLSRFYEPVLPVMLEKTPKKDELAWVVISRSELHRFEKRGSVIETMLSGAEIVDYRELVARLTGHLDVDSLDLWMFLYRAVRTSPLGRLYLTMRTCLERLFSVLLLVLLSPLFVLLAIIGKITNPGSILEIQTHLGYGGRPFKAWKFRGKLFLNRLPELWNVARGEMSWVGPKPERAEFYAEMDKLIPLFPIRLLARPGITGWAQVMGASTVSTAETKRKLEYDLFYLQRISPKMDLIIILRAVALALRLQKPPRALAPGSSI